MKLKERFKFVLYLYLCLFMIGLFFLPIALAIYIHWACLFSYPLLYIPFDYFFEWEGSKSLDWIMK